MSNDKGYAHPDALVTTDWVEDSQIESVLPM